MIGHAWSDDLVNWEIRPPLTEPAGFGHLEVPQVAVVDGQPLLLFCSNLMDGSKTDPADQLWAVPGPSVTGPRDLALARPVAVPNVYAPRLVQNADDAWHLIGFVEERDGAFAGEICDPLPVRYTAKGLTVVG